MLVVFKSAPEQDIPEKLRRLQFVRFDNRPGLARPLSELATALRQDLKWIRGHTRIGQLAGRWEARGKLESSLLRGDDLLAAKARTQRRPRFDLQLSKDLLQRKVLLNLFTFAQRWIDSIKLLDKSGAHMSVKTATCFGTVFSKR
jgi:hypothetical protein